MDYPTHPCLRADMLHDTGDEPLLYPAIYYKLQPHVVMACDELEYYGVLTPSPRLVACMCERMHDDALRAHPELQGYDALSVHTAVLAGSPLRDLLSILLISELLRRRRFFY